MSIDTWEKLIRLPNAQYKYLVEMNPSKYLACGSNWTDEGSNTYSISLAEQVVNAVTDDGIELTERTTVALVKSNAGSWYFDFYTQRLYVRATDSDELAGEYEGAYTMDSGTDEDTVVDTEPSSVVSGYYDGWWLYNVSKTEGSIISSSVYSSGWTFTLATAIAGQAQSNQYELIPKAMIIVYVWKYFGTGAYELDGVQYTPSVKQNSLPNLDLSVDDIVEGTYKFNFGSFSMKNDDNWWDTASEEYLWFNRKVLIYMGGEELPRSEYVLYFVGRVSDLDVLDHDVVLSVKDIRVGTFSSLPTEKYSSDDYLNLSESDEDKVIPIAYGANAWVVPVCIDTYVSANLRAVADDGGALTTESTEAHDSTEDDMTLLPVAPTTADNYYIGHTTNKFGKIHLLIGQKGIGEWEGWWMYWNGSSWKNLENKHDLSDGTDNFRPSEDDEWHTVSWKIPSNWATTSINGITAYWIRYNVTNFTSISQQPLGTRCKLDNTAGSKWKLVGHEINDILRVKKNGEEEDSSDYTNDLANGEFTLTSISFDSGEDDLAVAFQGKVISGGVGYSAKGADIAKDILKSYLSFLDVDLDLQSFIDTNAVRTHPLHIHMDTEQSSREVLQTVGRSIIAFFSPTEDGKLSFEAYEPTVPAGTLELFDPDFCDDWKVTKDHKFVKHEIQIEYARNVRKDVYRMVKRTNDDVVYKYGITDTLTLRTYILRKADALQVCKGVRDMCSKPITVVDTSFGVKGFGLFPTRKLKITRRRAADASGEFDAKVFRIRSVSKDTGSERTHVVAMDDLQTLGAAFCYVCFTCQLCVSEQETCTDCYECQVCVVWQSGCALCDECESCVASECGTCDGCQVCDTCEECDSCFTTEPSCPTCEDCNACQLCYTCETTVNFCEVCQLCYGCDTCDTCEAQVSCESCDTCQNCVSGCQDCEVCDVCDSCQEQVSCEKCDSCQDCVGCKICDTQQECIVCASCDDCQTCVICQQQVSCNKCDSCQLCVATEDCTACDVCDTCQSNVGCGSCDASCQLCVSYQGS